MEMKNIGTGQTYNFQDQELIHQLIASRLSQKMEMEYEELDGYELPPRIQFSMLKKPAVSLKYRTITCNSACIRLFEGVQYVLPIINSQKKRLAIIPCAEEESASVEWAKRKDGVWHNKPITSLEVVEKIYAMMGWDRNCRYKTLGRVANSPEGLIMLFDLKEAVFFSAKPSEYVDQDGTIKKRRTTYYPDEYKGRIGQSFNDYAASRQLSLFENLEGYVGLSYSDAESNERSLAERSGDLNLEEDIPEYQDSDNDWVASSGA